MPSNVEVLKSVALVALSSALVVTLWKLKRQRKGLLSNRNILDNNIIYGNSCTCESNTTTEPWYKRIPMTRVVRQPSEEDINQILKDKKPCIIRGLSFGDCVNEWSATALMKLIGERKVSVHVGNSPNLNFIHKNFKYETMTISNSISTIEQLVKIFAKASLISMI
eukprot:GHVR01177468.1.p1 GENE.GHVR01177468.1~~GHVR01177468.1.p1  ORF type:complete len:166 (-),score=25.31 GHVR01177468.1:59-556(-)